MKTIINFIFSIIACININLQLNAQTWHSVGDSTQRLNYAPSPGWVYTINQIDNLLYVGGEFIKAGNFQVNGIAIWNGVKWDSLGSGFYVYAHTVKDICKYNDYIYAGGYIVVSGVPNTACLAKWDGINWSAVGPNISSGPGLKTLKEYKNILYLGGGIYQVGNICCNQQIASWNDTNYASLNGGVWGSFADVRKMVIYNGELIAGGEFSKAGNVPAFCIASWNGNNWNDLDTGTAGLVECLVVDTINNFLYVGGGFQSVGGINGIHAFAIARWDGFQWDSLNNNLPETDVSAISMYHNRLYIGLYSKNGYITDTVFAKWDGNKWKPILGPNDGILTLSVFNDELYVGGYFNKINNDSMFGIARWYEPPDTTCDYLQAIIQPKNKTLKMSDSTTVHFYNNIIKGSSWRWDFGDGGTDTIRMPVHTYNAAGVFNVRVIVTYQNCTDTAFTTVTITDDTGIKQENKEKETEYLGQNIPNPFNNTTVIPYYVPPGSKGLLQIMDAKGVLIKEYVLQQGKNKLEVSMKEFKKGVYFYSLALDGAVKGSRKMVVK